MCIRDSLKGEGFSTEIIEALQSVSKTPEEETEYRRLSEGEKLDHYLEFVSRAKTNKIGREVKLSDIKDNIDITRIKDFTEKDMVRLQRYLFAMQELKTDDFEN